MVVADTPAAVTAEITRQRLQTFELVRVRPAGAAIASDGDASRIFDNDPSTYWLTSQLNGEGGWLGYAFDKPVAVRRIVILQPSNANYRHNMITVQSSHDGGATWQDVLPGPQNLFDNVRGIINLPASAGSATHWRVVAPAAQPGGPKTSWMVYELEFYTAGAPVAGSNASVSPPGAAQ